MNRIKCFVLLLVFSLFAVWPGWAGADSSKKGRELKILNSYKLFSIDPAKFGTHWLHDWAAADTFMTVSEEGEVVPHVLKALDRIDDLRWKLTLRDGVFFQNGKKLTAKAAALCITRQLAKNKRVQAILPGCRAEATGPLEVILTTSRPNAGVPMALAARQAPLYVYDAEVMEKAGGDGSKIAGAGAYTAPFEIVKYTPDFLLLKKNKSYWAGEPFLDKIEVKRVPDAQSRITAVQSGEADLAFYPPFEAAYTLKNHKDAFFLASPKALQSLLIYFNLKAAPFDDLNVRRAFSLGIDYRQIAEDVSEGIFEEAKGLYPAGMPYSLNNQRYAPEEAERILDQAGWLKGKDGFRYKDQKPLVISILLLPRAPEVKTVCIVIQEQLSRIGIKVELNPNEDIKGFMKGSPLAWHCSVWLSGSLSGVGDYMQPYIRRFMSGGDWNYGKISDPEIDEIGTQLQQTFDPQKRYDLLKRAQKIIAEEKVYMLASTFKRFMVVASPKWKNYRVSSYRHHLSFKTAP